MNALPVYNDRYVKSKTRTYGDKVCTSFDGVNVPEGDAECESFSQFYWFFISLWKQILSASIFRQLHLYNCRQANDRLSWWQNFWNWWRLVFIN